MMIDRRILLATVAGLFSLARSAGFAPNRLGPPRNRDRKDRRRMRAQLTPQQYDILRNQAPNGRDRVRC